jgi:hypothetical protein
MESELEKAERKVREGARQLARQYGLVVRLGATGPADLLAEAQKALETMERQQQQRIDHRDRLKAEEAS